MRRDVKLIGVLIASLILVVGLLPAMAQAQESVNSTEARPEEALELIENGAVIIDVRSPNEYLQGHLENAILIPLQSLEGSELLPEDKSLDILVYCNLGQRSTEAASILISMGYTNVYSLQGGLEAWREVYGDVLIEEYKTVGHNISVSFDASGPIIEITPIEFNYTAGGDCGCGCNQSSPNEVPTNVNSTVLEEDENHRVILIIYEINGTVYETVIETTILWSFEEVTDKENRTGSFVHVVTSTEGNVNEHYELSYDVNSTDYELRISTLLIPLDNGVGYNSSSTVMSYRPVNESEVTSIDSVAINGTVTLSELYSVLGKVSAELSELYAEEGYGGLATSYEAMGMEARFVSGLIETELKRYDWGILSNKATLNDPGFWTCLRGSLFCGGGVGVVIGCAVGTMGTGLVACLAAVFGVSSLGIMAAIASGTGVIWGCIVTCCCSGYDPCCDLL